MSDKIVIKENCRIEIIEKRSRFITGLYIAETVQKANEILKMIKEQEKGATHNCHAYRIMNGTTILESRSDDGEPSGTAGAPMLGVLAGENLVNVIAVTTRYFGGTKLGTGGLVKVYSDGVKKVIETAEKAVFLDRECVSIRFRINDTNKVNYVLKKYDAEITKRDFSTPVEYTILITGEQKLAIFKELTDIILQ